MIKLNFYEYIIFIYLLSEKINKIFLKKSNIFFFSEFVVKKINFYSQKVKFLYT